VLTFDPALWAGTLGYFHQSTKEAMEILRRLRRMTYQVLKALPEAVWFHTAEDPRDGKVSLERFLVIQERYIPDHLEQMRGNYATWLGLHPPRKPAIRTRARTRTSSAAASTTTKGGAMMAMSS
jgi:hypothetical protein